MGSRACAKARFSISNSMAKTRPAPVASLARLASSLLANTIVENYAIEIV